MINRQNWTLIFWSNILLRLSKILNFKKYLFLKKIISKFNNNLHLKEKNTSLKIKKKGVNIIVFSEELLIHLKH